MRGGWQTRLLHPATLLLGAMLAMLSLDVGAAAELMGRQAPPFSITSGAGHLLTLDMLRGKVVILFYETRNVVKKNSDIKNLLNDLWHDQPKEVRDVIVRVPVFDFSDVPWPLAGIWKDSMRKHSKRLDMTIYGDWDGKMARDYHMVEEESNVVVVDKKGAIRYHAHGRLTYPDYLKIKGLLDVLVRSSGNVR